MKCLAFFVGLLLSGTGLLVSCSKGGGEPEWLYSFKAPKGKVCGVGTAGIHIKGPSYQRATAIARAIEEIARQKGVTVNTSAEYFMQGSSAGGAVSALRVYSVQTTEGETVRAKVVETYYDKEKKLFHVLMCEE